MNRAETRAREVATRLINTMKRSDAPYMAGFKIEVLSLEREDLEKLTVLLAVNIKEELIGYCENLNKILDEYKELEGSPISKTHLKQAIRVAIDTLEDIKKSFDYSESKLQEEIGK